MKIRFNNLLAFVLVVLSLQFSYGEARIGLFIASVDPITLVHTQVISAGIEQLGLTKVIIMVNTSSDKDYSASVNERIRLVQRALKVFKGLNIQFEVIPEPQEGKREFTIRIAREQGQGRIYQIAGEDVQAKAKDLFAGASEVKSYILPRLDPNEKVDAHQAKLLDGFNLLKSEIVSSISSTEVKQRLELNQDVSEFLHPDVIEEINKENLYSRLSDSAAITKGKKLFEKMREYIGSIQSSERWKDLKVPDLAGRAAFNLREGVSTTDNLTFNRIQSEEASNELMMRIILKLNPQIKKSEAYNFQLWSQSHLMAHAKCERLLNSIRD